MVKPRYKYAAIGLTAIGVAMSMAGAARADVLPVTNLAFNVFDNGLNQPKDVFSTVAPTGWSIGSSGGQELIYVGQQGSEGYQGPGPANVYKVYTSPGFSVTVPSGTNFYQADGNPMFEDTIFQTVHGLTAGVKYTLEFQQAAGQQVGFSGDTTEQWRVFLGAGGIGTDCSSDPCTVTGTAHNDEQDSQLMHNASETNTNWEVVNLDFTLTADEIDASGNAILTFLAWGDEGHTSNLPPTVFLEGVNTVPTNIPEPLTLSLFGAGAVGAAALRRRKKAKSA